MLQLFHMGIVPERVKWYNQFIHRHGCLTSGRLPDDRLYPVLREHNKESNMTDNLKKKCELLIQNRAAISDKFKFEKDVMSIVAALIFTGADKEADIEKLEECRKILSKHTSAFSEYRDAIKLALISEMALSGEPEQYIDDVKDVYRKLHKGKIKDNSYMVLAAMLICDLGRQDDADVIIEKYNEIMKHNEKQHPFLTDSEDIPYVILLALSGRSVDSVISDIDESFDYLKNICKIGSGSDSIQGLSEILALTDGDIREKCESVITIINALKAGKADIGGYALPALGILINSGESAETIANDIIEADKYLRNCKGFDEKAAEIGQRMMFAASLAAVSYEAASPAISNICIGSAFSIIKPKQVATMITVTGNILPALLEVFLSSGSSDKTDSSQSEQSDTVQAPKE